MANDQSGTRRRESSSRCRARRGVSRRRPEFTAKARLRDVAEYQRMYRRSIDDPEGFWGDTARAELTWTKPFKKVLSWDLPWAKWFEDGELNLSANCLDRHLATRGDQTAILWEGEPGDQKTLTYRQLHAEVCRAANALKQLGVKTGDKVAIYLPMIPEAAVAMLACTRIGAVHTVVFGGFSSERLRDRINDCGAVLCITADGGWRRGKNIALKANVDAALAQTPTIKSCLVVRRIGEPIDMKSGPRRLVARRGAAGVGRVPRRSACRPSTRCSSSTRRARPASPRGSCTPPAATCWART